MKPFFWHTVAVLCHICYANIGPFRTYTQFDINLDPHRENGQFDCMIVNQQSIVHRINLKLKNIASHKSLDHDVFLFIDGVNDDEAPLSRKHCLMVGQAALPSPSLALCDHEYWGEPWTVNNEYIETSFTSALPDFVVGAWKICIGSTSSVAISGTVTLEYELVGAISSPIISSEDDLFLSSRELKAHHLWHVDPSSSPASVRMVLPPLHDIVLPDISSSQDRRGDVPTESDVSRDRRRVAVTSNSIGTDSTFVTILDDGANCVCEPCQTIMSHF
jgi:hypothetical protein